MEVVGINTTYFHCLIVKCNGIWDIWNMLSLRWFFDTFLDISNRAYIYTNLVKKWKQLRYILQKDNL